MTVSEWIAYVDQRVWGPGMLVLLMGTGVFLTLRTRFLPWRNLGWALKSVLGRDSRAKAGGAGDVSPFSALMTTLAATIGTGNIVGVATALVAGGPGALVWMEISALFGLSSKCAECLLAVKYRQRDAGGEMRGGPMYTMCAALRWKRLGGALAFLFALFTVLASLGMGDMAQANSIAGALADSFSVPARTTGVAVALLALVVILGGIRRIAGVCSVVVPLMAVLYLLAGTAVLLGHLSALPGAVAEMFRLAFSPAAAAGGAAGTMTASALNAARWGIARGCFSHEAGMGSAPNAAAAADVSHPVKQGLVQMLSVFIDTILICSTTAFMLLLSGVPIDAYSEGMNFVQAAVHSQVGPFGPLFITVSIFLFAFSSLVGNYYYTESNFRFIRDSKTGLLVFRLTCVAAIFIGAQMSFSMVWDLADVLMGLMALVNLVAILLLGYGYWEQQGFFRPEYEEIQDKWYQDEAFMNEVEAAAGDGAMLFTLPYMKNFENGSLNNMWDYTLLRGPLHSKTLKFTYGAGYGTKNDLWYRETSELEPDAMVAELRTQGMTGIYLDLDGYPEDEQQSALAALTEAAGCGPEDVIHSGSGLLCYIPLGQE